MPTVSELVTTQLSGAPEGDERRVAFPGERIAHYSQELQPTLPARPIDRQQPFEHPRPHPRAAAPADLPEQHSLTDLGLGLVVVPRNSGLGHESEQLPSPMAQLLG